MVMKVVCYLTNANEIFLAPKLRARLERRIRHFHL